MAHRALGISQRFAWAGLLCLAAVDAPLTGTLANPELDEVSGLARSIRSPELLWAHNDSGNAPVLYRVGLDGEHLGRVPVPGTQAVDWEDVAAFEQDGRPLLLIADTGDNLAWRASVTLYAVTDPGWDDATEPVWKLDFRYPDGPRDCEAVAVDPVDRDILLISKRDRPPRLYRLPLPGHAPAGVQTAEFLGAVGTLAPPSADERRREPRASRYYDMPTALDLSGDGRLAVIVTPRNAHLYRRAPGQSWPEVFAAPPRVVPLPHFPQIEAGALSADGRWLHIASEQRPAGFARMRLPL